MLLFSLRHTLIFSLLRFDCRHFMLIIATPFIFIRFL